MRTTRTSTVARAAVLAISLLATASSLVVAARPAPQQTGSANGGRGDITLNSVFAPPVAVAPAAASFSPRHAAVHFRRVARGLANPLFVTNAGDSRLFIVEQGGRIKILSGGILLPTPFLDISAKVLAGGERGLLGLAFHPQYATNGRFYVDYTDRNGNTVISEFRRTTSFPNLASTTERVLLRIGQPFPNHNGGMLAFGPDGLLYIGMGDGGSAGDPGNRAQNINSLLGKILRIDVNGRTGSLPYRIPPTNPYVGRLGDDRIWARGLRNPWRFSFDRATGALWIGDVGQDRVEEIDRSTAATGRGRGADYGWPVLEGNRCYRPASGCSTRGMTPPLAVYTHSLGCSVTGGYAYRGTAYPALRGAYLFGDFCSGRIWALNADGPNSQTPTLVYDTSMQLSSFGQGADGTLYVTDLGTGDVWLLYATAR